METYYTKVDVQADRWVAEGDKPTIIVENEEFKRYNLDEDCSCG
jgi:hypothetical protein